MTIAPRARRRTAGTQDVFAWLTAAGLTGVGVPMALGGTGGDRDDALCEVARVQRTDPEAAAALASHQCVIGALLAGRNVALRDERIPGLARGDVSGIWPSSAIDDMLFRGTAAVHAFGAAARTRLNGPLGRVAFGGRQPIVLICPVQWSDAHAPGLALLKGEQDGMHFSAPLPPADGAFDVKLAALDNVSFHARSWVDADGARIALMAELQALHATVRRWLARIAPANAGVSGVPVRDDGE